MTERDRAAPLGPGHDGLDPESPWDREFAGISVCFGEGRLTELGAEAATLASGDVLLVTDPGIVAAGHAAVAEESLEAAGFAVTLFTGVAANPTDEHVAAGTEAAMAGSVQLIVAIGGGSAMDCAKGINFLLTNGGRMEDYWGKNKATKPMLPSIGIPTTAGTGSEAQSYALITHSETHRKMACGDDKARFRSVILDPALLATVPRSVAAAAGMDALSHALETLVTTARTPVSEVLSQRAFELLAPVTDQLAVDPDIASPFDDAQLRSRAGLGAFLAGAAIDHSMLGAAHASANPLTARHGVPHGDAIGLMLPPVIRFNMPVADRYYRQVDLGGAIPIARRVEATRNRVGMPTSLTGLGITRDELPHLAAAACREWTGGFNPRPLEQHDFQELYEQVL